MTAHVKKLLIVGAGIAQKRVIEVAKASGFYVIAADGNPYAPGLDISDEVVVTNIIDANSIREILQHHEDTAGVLSVSTDAPMLAIATVCEERGLPYPRIEMVQVSRNKLAQRTLLRTSRLPTPKFALVTSADYKWANPYPVVVKPTDGAGSRGVTLVEGPSKLSEAIQTALTASHSKQVLVEQFVQGPEYSVEGFMVNGKYHAICVCTKERSAPPSLLDIAVHFDPFANHGADAQMRELAARAAAACGYDNCPVHLELIASDDDLYVVELAARGAGFKVFSEILPEVTGVNTSQVAIEYALGKTPNIQPKGVRCATLRFLHGHNGTLHSITGLDAARSIPGVSEVEIYAQPGDTIRELRSGADRIGHVLTYSTSIDDSNQASLDALQTINIHYQ